MPTQDQLIHVAHRADTTLDERSPDLCVNSFSWWVPTLCLGSKPPSKQKEQLRKRGGMHIILESEEERSPKITWIITSTRTIIIKKVKSR